MKQRVEYYCEGVLHVFRSGCLWKLPKDYVKHMNYDCFRAIARLTQAGYAPVLLNR